MNGEAQLLFFLSKVRTKHDYFEEALWVVNVFLGEIKYVYVCESWCVFLWWCLLCWCFPKDPLINRTLNIHNCVSNVYFLNYDLRQVLEVCDNQFKDKCILWTRMHVWDDLTALGWLNTLIIPISACATTSWNTHYCAKFQYEWGLIFLPSIHVFMHTCSFTIHFKKKWLHVLRCLQNA